MSRRVAHNDLGHDLCATNRCTNGVGCIPFRMAWANSFARAGRFHGQASACPCHLRWFPPPYSGGTQRLAFDE